MSRPPVIRQGPAGRASGAVLVDRGVLHVARARMVHPHGVTR
jgi:hypothetical protein